MRRVLFSLLLATSLFAQEIDENASYWDFHPWHAGATAIGMGSAAVDPKHAAQQGDLVFNKASVFTYLIVPVSRTSFFFPRVEWNTFTLNWNKNPKFNETHFHYMQFALTFYSTAVENWRWIARADYNIDVKHFSHGKAYGLYSVLLWGTHQFHRKWHYHVGTLGYTGFEGQEVYPVIGVDFSPNKKWTFLGIFPITYSIDYNFNPEWRLSLKGRPMKERFRTGPYEPQPRSIFSYSATGLELNLHYEKFLRVEAEIFGGYNFGGNFYIKNKHGHKSLYTHVQGSPYGGASLNWGF